MTTIDNNLERELDHREWVARLSDDEFREWEKNSAGFAVSHFEVLEATIAKAIDSIQQHPHSMFNISTIGSCLQSLGEMMHEYDYLGAIKMGLGHDRELQIMHNIEAIAAEIKDGVEWYESVKFGEKK